MVDFADQLRSLKEGLVQNTQEIRQLRSENASLREDLRKSYEIVHSIVDRNEKSAGFCKAPFADRKWLRLALIVPASMACCGLLPGQTLFIQMFIEFGVGASACKVGHLQCTAQQVSVSAGFNFGAIISQFGNLILGWAFDRYGPQRLAFWSAFVSSLGLLLMEIPLLGTLYGYDAVTSRLFPIFLTITDTGATGVGYAVLGMVYHFPCNQTLLVSLWGAAQTVPASFPNLLDWIMEQTGMNLPTVFALWLVVELVALIIIYVCVPSIEEYREEGKRVVGIPLPDSSTRTIGEDFQRGCRVLGHHIWDHLWFCMNYCIVNVAWTIYASMLGSYLKMIMGSSSAAGYFTSELTLLCGTLGVGLSIIASGLSDMVGKKSYLVLIGAWAVCLGGISLFVGGSKFSDQMTVTVLAMFLGVFQAPIMGKYALFYCMPSQMGIVMGVLFTACTVFLSFAMSFAYIVLLALPPQFLPSEIMTLFIFSALFCTAYLLRIYRVALPEMPVLLPEDEAALAEPFGGETIDDVLYVLHMEKADRPKLLELLSHLDGEGMKELTNRVDVMRVTLLSMGLGATAETCTFGALFSYF